jgi:hypothetical protein
MTATTVDIQAITPDLIKCSYHFAHKLKRFIPMDLEDLSQELIARTLAAISSQCSAIRSATPETFKSHVMSVMYFAARHIISDKCKQDDKHKVSAAKQQIDALCYSECSCDDIEQPSIADTPSNSVTGHEGSAPILEYNRSRYDDPETMDLRIEIERVKEQISPAEARLVDLIEMGYKGREVNKILGYSHNYANTVLNNLRTRLIALKDIYYKQLTFNGIKYNINDVTEIVDPHSNLKEVKMANAKKNQPAKKSVPAKKSPAKAATKEKVSRSELVANFAQPMLDKGKMTRREIAEKVSTKFGLTPGTAYIYVSKLASPTKPATKAPAKKATKTEVPAKKTAAAPKAKTKAKAPAKKPAPAKKGKKVEDDFDEEPAPKAKGAKAPAKKGKQKAPKADDDFMGDDPFAEEDDGAEDNFDPEEDAA